MLHDALTAIDLDRLDPEWCSTEDRQAARSLLMAIAGTLASGGDEAETAHAMARCLLLGCREIRRATLRRAVDALGDMVG